MRCCATIKLFKKGRDSKEDEEVSNESDEDQEGSYTLDQPAGVDESGMLDEAAGGVLSQPGTSRGRGFLSVESGCLL